MFLRLPAGVLPADAAGSILQQETSSPSTLGKHSLQCSPIRREAGETLCILFYSMYFRGLDWLTVHIEVPSLPLCCAVNVPMPIFWGGRLAGQLYMLEQEREVGKAPRLRCIS